MGINHAQSGFKQRSQQLFGKEINMIHDSSDGHNHWAEFDVTDNPVTLSGIKAGKIFAGVQQMGGIELWECKWTYRRFNFLAGDNDYSDVWETWSLRDFSDHMENRRSWYLIIPKKDLILFSNLEFKTLRYFNLTVTRIHKPGSK